MSSNDNNFLSISSGIFPCPWARSCCSISVKSSLMSWMSCYILLKYGVCDGISMAFRVSSDLSPLTYFVVTLSHLVSLDLSSPFILLQKYKVTLIRNMFSYIQQEAITDLNRGAFFSHTKKSRCKALQLLIQLLFNESRNSNCFCVPTLSSLVC